MKINTKWLLVGVVLPLSVNALSFAPNTVFLEAGSPAKCESQGGVWTEWYNETYCTKTPAGFTDVAFSHPNVKAVGYAQVNGWIQGYADGTFQPERLVNRAELLKIVSLAQPNTSGCVQPKKFADVPAGIWYETYVNQATCAGVVSGYADGTFKPGKAVLLAEAVKIIALSFGLAPENATPIWYEAYVQQLAARGALPTSIKTIESPLTRAQVVEIMYRLQTQTTHLPSHSLQSLSPQRQAETKAAEAAAEAQAEQEAQQLFEELDLESLLDL